MIHLLLFNHGYLPLTPGQKLCTDGRTDGHTDRRSGDYMTDRQTDGRTENCPVFQQTGTIFKLNSLHENWAKNVTSRVFTCFHSIHIEKNASPTEINKTNVLTNFHDDWAKIVTSRVFTRKTAPPTGGHTNILTNFELNQDFIGTKLLTKFHEDLTINVASRVFTNKS
ncbi:hypothetical protein DPMN_041658 [Dreissena polymorpha]|uniref:Uncharacterized protein n=1 Tax=Dreissena polymorpha TaxID=45954 RepID=A0A9D4CX82_DREPO|nr:hypothetical protein DPMN_041658 [Dreissena polymorpha]